MYSVNGQTILDMSYDSLSVVEVLVDRHLDERRRNGQQDTDRYIELENFRNGLRSTLQRRTTPLKLEATPVPKVESNANESMEDLL